MKEDFHKVSGLFLRPDDRSVVARCALAHKSHFDAVNVGARAEIRRRITCCDNGGTEVARELQRGHRLFHDAVSLVSLQRVDEAGIVPKIASSGAVRFGKKIVLEEGKKGRREAKI